MLGELMKPYPRAERFLALCVLVVLVGAVAATIYVPLRSAHRHYDQAIADGLDRLGRYARTSALRTQVEAAAEKFQDVGDSEYLLHGETESLLAAELQTLVARLVESNHGKLISSQVPQITAPTPKGDDLTRVAISVQLNASAPVLQLALHAIENHKPYLFVDQLTVRSNQGRASRQQPGVEPEFTVQITISAFARIASKR